MKAESVTAMEAQQAQVFLDMTTYEYIIIWNPDNQAALTLLKRYHEGLFYQVS